MSAAAPLATTAASSSRVPGQGWVPDASTMNASRIRLLAERLANFLKTGFRSEPNDFSYACLHLAKGIDHALSHNEVPPMAHDLPSIIKQVCQRRKDANLQSAIMLLMVSVKNACKNGWFKDTDASELLAMANEIASTFGRAENITIELTEAHCIISKVMPRFFPQMKMDRIIISLSAQPGYDFLVADFHISKSMAPIRQETIRLFVAQTDNMDTSSCVISPPQVNFLLNGKGVVRRTAVSVDNGPQFPTDVTAMLRYGTNLIQAIGQFNGNYIIAVACMSPSSPDPKVLQDYVQPSPANLVSDSEIIEGPSRISVNCPISYKRINTPVKGCLCRHHQCFDYDNFMEINSRKPSWRCPHCNQPTSCIDLRIDQNMVKVLREVGPDVADVLISADGSWKVVADQDSDPDQRPSGANSGQQDGLQQCEPKRLQNSATEVVDLTHEETEDCNRELSSSGTEFFMNYANQMCLNACDTEDRKPFQDTLGFHFTGNLSELGVTCGNSEMVQESSFRTPHEFWSGVLSSVSACGEPTFSTTGIDEYLSVNALTLPVLTDAVSPSLGQEPMDGHSIAQSAISIHNVPQAGQTFPSENIQLQPSQLGNSIVGTASERPSIPRRVDRVAVAVQALPAQTQVPNSHHSRPRTTAANPNPIISNVTFPGVPQASPVLIASPGVFNVSQDHEDIHNVPNHSFQSFIGHPTHTSLVGTRTTSENQRVGAFGSSFGLSPSLQNAHYQRPSNLMVPQTVNQQANIVQQISHFPSFQPSGQGVVMPTASTMDHRSRLMIPPLASQFSKPPVVTSQLQGTISSSYMAPTRLSIGDNRRNLVGGSHPIPFTESSQEHAVENWRPTGRMRGSLTGRAYSAALSQYIIQPTPPAPPRPSITTVTPTTSEQLPVLMSNSINSQGQSQVHSAGGFVGRPGSSSITPEQSSMH